MNGYLTKRSNGLFLLTFYEPVLAKVGTTPRIDAYAQPGDPIAVNNLCPWSISVLWDADPDDFEPLKPQPCQIVRGRLLNKTQ